MNRLHVCKVPARAGMLGVFGVGLKALSNTFRQLFAALPGAHSRPDLRFSGAVRVLVADDNPVNLMVISAQLEALGLVPLLAADGAEAVALACELHFDLILMDVQMPILGGLAATAAIRRFEARTLRRPVPVVAYASTPLDAETLARHGLDGCIPKPCRDHTLKACLARWCPTHEPMPGPVPGGPCGKGGSAPARFGQNGGTGESPVSQPIHQPIHQPVVHQPIHQPIHQPTGKPS